MPEIRMDPLTGLRTVVAGEPATRLTNARPLSVWKWTWRGCSPPTSVLSTGKPSVSRNCRTNSMFCAGTLPCTERMPITWAPPKTLATNRRRSPPTFIVSPISRSIAWTPKRAAPSACPSAP